MTRPIPASYAKIQIPAWLFGGSPEGLLQYSRLQSKPVAGEPAVWAVQPEEVHLRRKPDLIKVHHLAGPLVDGSRFSQLIPSGPNIGHWITDDRVAQVNQLGERAVTRGQLVDALSHAQLSLMVSPDDRLAEMAEHYHNEIRQIGMEDDPSEKAFANASAHFIWRDEVIVHRMKFASIWLRFEHDHQFRSQGPGYLEREFATNDRVFSSSASLYSGMYTFDAYMSPLLASLSPWVWGYFTAHAHGNYIQTLGISLGGVDTMASELLHLIRIEGSVDPVAKPPVRPRSSSLAVEWWGHRLNDLFATLSDFSYFVDSAGFYNASAHSHALATIEQLFRRVTSLQIGHRDLHARRVLLFTILDTLQRLTRKNLETFCSLRYAQKTLARLRKMIPEEAQDILLHRAAASIDALKRMQDGFFLSNGREGIDLPEDDGSLKFVGFDTAVAQYIKVLRDATHGHGTNREGNAPRTNALLAHHDGDVPHDLGWLGFLYLLDFLSMPEVFRNILHSDAAKLKVD